MDSKGRGELRRPCQPRVGRQLHLLHASTEPDFDTVFATLVRLRAGALIIGDDAFFNSRSQQLATLALRHAVPAIFQDREFVAAGGPATWVDQFPSTSV
jgi:putative tryptophan/tyrosine transport system substrate-binding protein